MVPAPPTEDTLLLALHRLMVGPVRTWHPQATVTQVGILLSCVEHGSTTLTDLTHEFGSSVGSVGRALDVLEQSGLIRRQKDCLSPKSKRIVPTAMGQEMISNLCDPASA